MTHSRKLSCALFLFVTCSLLVMVEIPRTHAGQYNIQVDFSFDTDADPEKQVVGYRLYQEETPVCESDSSDQKFIACLLTSEPGTFNFTMSALYSDQSESPQSEPFIFAFTDQPQTTPINFTWEYAGSDITGFKIYHNNTLLCEIPESTAREYSYETELTGSDTFTINAIHSDNSEVSVLNPTAIADSNNGPVVNMLAAAITVDPSQGTIPFSTLFDGSGSSGTIADYEWSFGDGSTGNGMSAGHTYELAGTYSVTLTVYDTAGNSSRYTTILTATEITIPPAPPSAIISSSSAIGDAPLAVIFDGSSSTSNQSQIISYSWDFGDGSTAGGVNVSHNYTEPGNYQTVLTVTDETGLSSQATTPVIINAPPPPINEPPLAVLAVSEFQGKAPITITFSAADSTDSDGTITDYLWDFGDGSSATGTTVEHSYTEAADYTVTLQVQDDGGESGSVSTLITVLASDESLFLYELGELQISHEWLPVSFSQPFNDPIIVFGPPTAHDPEPVTVRVRNVTRDGYEVRLQEWDYLDDIHLPEVVSFFVMEQGAYDLPNGTKVEAGTFTGTSRFQTFQLKQSQEGVPVILTQVVSETKPNAVTGRVRRTGSASFQYKLQEQETTKNKHVPETVHYIAWQPGSGLLSGDLHYETAITSDSVKHDWVELGFATYFAEPPLFLADMQSQDGGDSSTTRTQNIANGSVQIKIEEEQSKDPETRHTSETAGYIIFGFPLN